MLVYRVCSYGEVIKILEDKNFDELGKTGQELISIQQQKNVSNHEYNFQKRYLHFFKDKLSIFHLKLENQFLCTYNIDEELLSSREKEGYYLDLANLRKTVRVPEYAIESSLLKFENLEKVQYINEFIDIDDYYVDNELTESTDLIYQKPKAISRERRIS